MNESYCAVCGNRVDPELDHVEIEGTKVYLGKENSVKNYDFHLDCWTRVSGGWEIR